MPTNKNKPNMKPNMKDNSPVEIEYMTIGQLYEKIGKIHEHDPPFWAILRALNWSNDRNVYAGVGYDYKTTYLYIFDEARLQPLPSLDLYMGLFARYDAVTKKTIVEAAGYNPDQKIHMIFGRLLGRVTVRTPKDAPKVKLFLHDMCKRVGVLAERMQEAAVTPIDSTDAYTWCSKWFHNSQRSDVIALMFSVARPTVWQLYCTIARYYSRRSSTPHMQWWNVSMSERLLVKPRKEASCAKAWTHSSQGASSSLA